VDVSRGCAIPLSRSVFFNLSLSLSMSLSLSAALLCFFRCLVLCFSLSRFLSLSLSLSVSLSSSVSLALCRSVSFVVSCVLFPVPLALSLVLCLWSYISPSFCSLRSEVDTHNAASRHRQDAHPQSDASDTSDDAQYNQPLSDPDSADDRQTDIDGESISKLSSALFCSVLQLTRLFVRQQMESLCGQKVRPCVPKRQRLAVRAGRKVQQQVRLLRLLLLLLLLRGSLSGRQRSLRSK
jgi:hypothetical protein